MNKKKLIFQLYFIIFINTILLSQSNSKDSFMPKLNSVEKVIDWCENNLKYQNDDPWDPAPDLEKVFKDKYGDCKMLAGVVYELLKSVGQESKIVTIKRTYWHMFVIYKENDNWRIIENEKLRKEISANLDDIKKIFKVKEFKKTSDSYDDFKKWFNEEIYKKNKK